MATTAAAGLFQIVPRHVLGGPGHTPPSGKLNIAGIGPGWMGERNMLTCGKENIVALCDVDHSFAAKTFKAFPDAKVYTDFRVMLEKQKDIDAVLVATPDHTHAVISMAAIQAGKHVFCQKPLTHDIYESRMLAKAAKEAGVVTRMGIQGHSAEGLRVTYHFPARDGFSSLKLHWYEGQEPPRPPELEEGRNLPDQGGVLFKGEKGIIMCGAYGDSPRLIPESAMKAYERPEKKLPRIKGSHEQNWIDAIKSAGKASADFEYSGPLTELALLGNIAKKFPDRKLLWGNEQMKVTNFDEANEWVRRPYRKGWAL